MTAELNPEQSQKKVTIPEAIAKLHEIQQGLILLVTSLHENIQALDDDPDFQDSLKDLQQDAEARASSLESEVKRLRSDVESLKDLLGDGSEKKPVDSN